MVWDKDCVGVGGRVERMCIRRGGHVPSGRREGSLGRLGI